MRTTKISIAIDKQQLRRARAVAKAEGLSLSAYIARALVVQLAEQRRIEAARELVSSWGVESEPTVDERDAFLAQMARPRRRRTAA